MADQGQTIVRRIALASARRPAVLVAGAFIAGIFLHRSLPDWPVVWLAATALCAAGAAILARRGRSTSIALVGALTLLGLMSAQLADYRYPADEIGLFAGDEPVLARVELRIADPPRVLKSQFDRFPLPPRQVTQGRVTAVLTTGGWREASGTILVQINEPHADLAVGQTIRALGMLGRPVPAMNPGQFDWSKYYRRQRILASMSIPAAANVTIVERGRAGALAWLQRSARNVLARGFDTGQSLDHALLRALVLGDGDPELRDVQEQFRRTGTSHHLAISGMHIAILAVCIYWLCRLLMVAPRPAAYVMMALVLLYGLAALASPPVVRSVVLCLAFGLGLALRRGRDGVQLLAISVLLMLVYDPLDLYGAGFQLSFLTVLGLMLAAQRMQNLIWRPLTRDELLLQPKVPWTIARAVSRYFTRATMAAVAAGMVAWLVSSPLVAWHFEQLNPWAIVASVLLGPVVFAALVGGFFKIILTLLMPWWAGAWATMAAGPIALMRRSVTWMGLLPGSDLPLPTPPLWLMAGYFALLCLPLVPGLAARARRLARCGPAAALAMILIVPVVSGLAPASRSVGDVRLTVLSVGAGQCVVLETEARPPILFDAGSTTGDVARRCIRPYLRHRGRSTLDAIFISHANIDHYGAAGELAEALGPRTVVTSPLFAGPRPPRAIAELQSQLAGLGVSSKTVAAGQTMPLAEGLEVQVLWPPADSSVARLDVNDSSLVLRIVCRGRSILLPGDIGDDAIRQLLKDPHRLKSDILVAPHHGSATESTARFLAAVDPRTIISSSGRRLSRKQVQFDALTSSRTRYRTGDAGAVTIHIDRTGALSTSAYRTSR